MDSKCFDIVNINMQNTGNHPELSWTNYQHFTSHTDQHLDLMYLYRICIPVSSLAKLNHLFEKICFLFSACVAEVLMQMYTQKNSHWKISIFVLGYSSDDHDLLFGFFSPTKKKTILNNRT